MRLEIDPSQVVNSLGFKGTDTLISREVYDRIPKDTMKKFESNMINVSWFHVAMSNPNYFEAIHSPSEDDFEKQKYWEHQSNIVEDYCKYQSWTK